MAKECNPQDMSISLRAYAAMGRRPGERVLGALDARMEAVAKNCNSQNVANSLWAYATMGRRPRERVLEALDASALPASHNLWNCTPNLLTPNRVNLPIAARPPPHPAPY